MAKQKKGGGGGGGGKKKGAKSGKKSAPPAAGAGDDAGAPATGGVVGLTNLGNTCFFNSVLQVLASAPLVRDHYGAPAASTSGGPLGRALSTTVGALTGRAPGGAGPDKRGARTHSPAGLLAAVVKIAPQFRGRAQQDAHELLRLLLEGVRSEEDGKSAGGGGGGGGDKKKKAAPVSLAPPSASASYAERVFGGQLASRLACACGDASTSLEPFMDLSLPVPTVVVENGAAKTDASTKPPKKPAAALTAKQAKRAAKAAKQKQKAAQAKEAEKEEQGEVEAAAAPSVATDSPTTDASSLSSAPRPATPAIDVPVGGAAGTAAVPAVVPAATLPPPPPPPPPPPSDPFPAGSPDAGCELGEETPVVSPVLLAPVMVNPPTSTSPPPAADAPAVPPPPDTYDDMDRTLYADAAAAAADADAAADASPPATPGSSRGADAGSSSSSSSPSSSRASSPDMAGLGGLFDGVKIDDGAAPARTPPTALSFADDTVAPGADLAACLASFFAAESVEWTCPTKEKEKEAASASRSSSPASSSPPSTPPPNVRPLSMRRSVSFCEAGPSVHVVPGSAEQRGTDFEEAARGRAAFRRPLRADGVCLLVTAEADAATRDKVHVALHPYDDDADAVARVLPQAVAVASVPIDRVEDSDDEAEQARLRGGCQALMDCVADMVAHGGVPNMERMADGGLDLARDAAGAWRVSGVSPAGPWSWPAGAAVLSPSPSPSQRGFHKPNFTGPGSPQVRGGALVAAAAAKAKQAAADAAADDVKHTACTKRYAIHAAPPLLTLHLKRFGRDARGRLRKLGGHVAFPLDVALGAVAPPGALPADVAARRYSLHGVVEHMGSMRGGHYVAYVRRDAAVKKKKKKDEGDNGVATTTTSWYRASDSHVAGVSEADVLGCEAYILLYGRVEEEDAGRE